MNCRTFAALAAILGAAVVAGGCAGTNSAALGSQIEQVVLTPDNPENPRAVRFDVPTAMVMGMTGERVPVTLQARIATREIAERELAHAGYCPNGFTGPEAVFFPGGDRSHSAFIVECVGG